MVIWQETRSISTFKNIKSAAQATCHVIKNDQCKSKSNSLTAKSVALKKKKKLERKSGKLCQRAVQNFGRDKDVLRGALTYFFFPIIIIIIIIIINIIIIIMIIIIFLLLFYLRDRLRQEGGTAYILD